MSPAQRRGRASEGRQRQLRVWIDQDLCTGDGLCVDYVPEVFSLLEDGIAYVIENGKMCNEPGGLSEPARVPARLEKAVMDAASVCPGECIFVEDAPQET